jgi:hypothetical protein
MVECTHVIHEECRMADLHQTIRERILALYGERVLSIVAFEARNSRGASESGVAIIVTDPVQDWATEETALAAALGEDCPVTRLHVFGETEYLETHQVPGTVAYPIARQGTPLYEKPRRSQAERRTQLGG